jgi:hypothetical protein
MISAQSLRLFATFGVMKALVDSWLVSLYCVIAWNLHEPVL